MRVWNPTYCKLGTMPYTIHIDKRSVIDVGNFIKYKTDRYGKYYTAKVDNVDPLRLSRW